ncbi:MAG: phosphopantetheine-binding protein, partial [Pseudomonadales bacterium]
MTINAPSLNVRVAALSPAKRVLLARRLRESLESADSAHKSLIAYWSGAASEQELRAFLAQQLPEYMPPTVLLPLTELPRTAVGKLDYKALPLPTESQSAQSSVVEEGHSPVEQTLHDIWRDVLLVNNVQGSDNFFALGGDSILGLQVVSRGRREGLELTPRDIFALETLADLAAAITQRAGAGASSVESNNTQ